MPDDEQNTKLYKEISADIRSGLKDIYQQISSASTKTDALFQEASEQLKEVVKATESAAMNIMEIVEKQLDNVERNTGLLARLAERLPDAPEIAEMQKNNAALSQSLTGVLTALSFQDITGQRLKKVAQAMEKIEKSVIDLYLSSGLALDAAEKDPTRDAGSIRNEANQAVRDYRGKGSELKGPDANGCSQEAIDAMLSQLGF